MKRYEVQFADAAIADLASIFEYLLIQAGERVARDFVGRLEAACLDLDTFPERGTVRDEVLPGLRLIGYRRQASIAFVVTGTDVIILRVLRSGQDVNAMMGTESDE